MKTNFEGLKEIYNDPRISRVIQYGQSILLKMSNKTNIVSSDAHSSVIPAADTERESQSSRSDPRQKHKGKGAKTRSAEKFRTKKNEETYNQRMESNRAFWDSFHSRWSGNRVKIFVSRSIVLQATI